MKDLEQYNERKQKEALSVQRESALYDAFASKGVGSLPTQKGVTIDGQLVNLDPLEAALLPIVTTTCQYRGQSTTGRDLAFIVQEVAKSLRRSCPAIHLEEIREACELGRDGEFGEVFGVNAATIMSWVRQYVDGGHHGRYMKAYMDRVPAARQIAEKSRAGIENLAKANALDSAFRRYSAIKRGEKVETEDPEGGIDMSAFMKPTRDGKPGRSPLDPLWDHDGTGFDGGYARDLNALGWPGKDLKEIFENMIAEGITALKGKDGYLIRRV